MDMRLLGGRARLGGAAWVRGMILAIAMVLAPAAACAQPLAGPRLEVTAGRWWSPMKLTYVNDYLKCSVDYGETTGSFQATDIRLRAGEGETPLLASCGPAMLRLGKEAQFPRVARKAGGFSISVAPVPAQDAALPAAWKTEGEVFFDSNAAEMGIGEAIAVTKPGAADIESFGLVTHREAPVTGIWLFDGAVKRPELRKDETLGEPGTALALIGPKGITVVSLDRQATSPELLVKPPRIVIRAGDGQRSCLYVFSVTTQDKQAFRAQWRVRLLPPDTPEEEVTRLLSLNTQGGRK